MLETEEYLVGIPEKNDYSIDGYDRHLLTAEEEIEIFTELRAKEDMLEQKLNTPASLEEDEKRIQELQKDITYIYNQIVVSNIGLVCSVASRIYNRRYTGSFTYEDLQQEGHIGLLKAIKKFDISRGNKFSSYATSCIEYNILDALSDFESTIKIPSNRQEDIFLLKRTVNQKITELRRTLSTAEFKETAVQLFGEAKAETTLQTLSLLDEKFVNLEDLNPEKEDTEQSSYVSKHLPISSDIEGYISNKQTEEFLRHVLVAKLTEKEAKVIIGRYGLLNSPEMTLQEVGDTFDPPVTRERCRQLEISASNKIMVEYLKQYARDDTMEKLEEANLSDMEFLVIAMRYGLFGFDIHTEEEIQGKLKLTRRYRVKKILPRAVKKIERNGIDIPI